MPIGDRIRRRRGGRRRVRPGETYTREEEERGEIELEDVEPRSDPPPEHTRGEPWGWTKEGDKPRGWREDGRYGPEPGHDDPGPYDGKWQPPDKD